MLPKITPKMRQSKSLESTTYRDFTGGLNVIDDDMNLSYKFATISKNIYADSDGSMRVRYGTQLFTVLPEPVINIEYFNASIIAVTNTGKIYNILGDGSFTLIWSSWSATEFCSFAQFDGNLIICNGIDKPVTIDSNFVVTFLEDLGTLTNINVPVCKYVVSNGRYLVMAGDPLNPERVHISAKDAPGTWTGDPPPNDATRQDVGSVLANASTLRGLLSFRDKLLVLYAEGIIVGQLGIYDNASPPNHTPTFDDAIDQYGCVSHRAALARGDDGLFMDLQGVPSIKRTILDSGLKPERVSLLIDPLITALSSVLSFQTLEDRVFHVYNTKTGQYMLFIPNADTLAGTTETPCYVYSYRPKLKQDNWAEFRGWNFTCGCRTLQGNIFFGDADGFLWLYGSRDNPIYADAVDTYQDADVNNPEGNPIDYTWEWPWIDMRQRTRVKNSKYISMDTRGAADFTVDMYIDNIITQPQLSMDFSGGEQGAFGDGPQPFGGGRITSYKKKYAWPCKFEIAKFMFSGATSEELAFVSLSLLYQLGSENR